MTTALSRQNISPEFFLLSFHFYLIFIEKFDVILLEKISKNTHKHIFDPLSVVEIFQTSARLYIVPVIQVPE